MRFQNISDKGKFKRLQKRKNHTLNLDNQRSNGIGFFMRQNRNYLVISTQKTKNGKVI